MTVVVAVSAVPLGRPGSLALRGAVRSKTKSRRSSYQWAMMCRDSHERANRHYSGQNPDHHVIIVGHEGALHRLDSTSQCWRLSRDMQMVQFGCTGPVPDMPTSTLVLQPLSALGALWGADLRRCGVMAHKRFAFSELPIDARLVDRFVCEPMADGIGSQCRRASDCTPYR